MRQKNGRSMDVVLKQGALNISMVRLGCCMPPIKISGYAPASNLGQ